MHYNNFTVFLYALVLQQNHKTCKYSSKTLHYIAESRRPHFLFRTTSLVTSESVQQQTQTEKEKIIHEMMMMMIKLFNIQAVITSWETFDSIYCKTLCFHAEISLHLNWAFSQFSTSNHQAN